MHIYLVVFRISHTNTFFFLLIKCISRAHTQSWPRLPFFPLAAIALDAHKYFWLISHFPRMFFFCCSADQMTKICNSNKIYTNMNQLFLCVCLFYLGIQTIQHILIKRQMSVRKTNSGVTFFDDIPCAPVRCSHAYSCKHSQCNDAVHVRVRFWRWCKRTTKATRAKFPIS